MEQNIYRKSFIFQTTRFEEYQNGRLIQQGSCNTIIMAKVISSDTIAMMLQNDIPVRINQRFGLPIFGSQNGDILADRIQYGRIPDSFSWNDSSDCLSLVLKTVIFSPTEFSMAEFRIHSVGMIQMNR